MKGQCPPRDGTDKAEIDGPSRGWGRRFNPSANLRTQPPGEPMTGVREVPAEVLAEKGGERASPCGSESGQK